MQFTTPVGLGKDGLDIGHRSRIMLLGSCFAQNIGERLLRHKFNVCCNPFGIIYNPLSIATVLQRIVSGKLFDEQSPELVEHGGKWHSALHHGDFSRSTKEELLYCINNSLSQAHSCIEEADIITITLGTAYVYERQSDGCVVSNCHKLPANNFSRRLLSVEEIVECLGGAMGEIAGRNPKVKFLFTVSPIRHLRDGAHDNQLSKAALLIAADRLQAKFPGCTAYFPAYEIMMDELRDYRFYAEDMAHPSPVAVEYIWQRFCEQHITKESIALGRTVEEVMRAMEHRPFDADSSAYKRFIEDTIKKIASIEEQHPYLDFEKEIEQCNTLLNR